MRCKTSRAAPPYKRHDEGHAVGHVCPTFWFACPALSKEELTWVTSFLIFFIKKKKKKDGNKNIPLADWTSVV